MDDSIASPADPEIDMTIAGGVPIPLMAVTHNEAGDLVITIPKETRAGDLIMSLLNGLRTS